MGVDVREWHPRHELEEVQVTIRFDGRGQPSVTVIGRSSTHRSALWTVQGMTTEGPPLRALMDHLGFVLHSVWVDRPTSQAKLQDALAGVEQHELPW